MASILCFKNDQVWFSQSCDAQCHIHVKSISMSFPSSGVLMLWQISPLAWHPVTAPRVANCGGGKWSHVHRNQYKTWHDTGANLGSEQCQFQTKQMLLTALSLQSEMFPLHAFFWIFTWEWLSLILHLSWNWWLMKGWLIIMTNLSI